MKDIILVDVDHVLSDSYWRDSLASGPGGWDAYHAGLGQDAPIRPMTALIKALRLTYNVVAITARPEKYRDATMTWFFDHDITVDDLLMRPDNNYAPAHLTKLELTEHLLERVAFVLDDRDDVCSTFHARGVIVMQVRTHRTTEED